MKINTLPGDFLFKGLIKINNTNKWILTEEYFLSAEDMKKSLTGTAEIKWPVEVYDDGSIYVPDPSEYVD